MALLFIAAALTGLSGFLPGTCAAVPWRMDFEWIPICFLL